MLIYGARQIIKQHLKLFSSLPKVIKPVVDVNV